MPATSAVTTAAITQIRRRVVRAGCDTGGWSEGRVKTSAGGVTGTPHTVRGCWSWSRSGCRSGRGSADLGLVMGDEYQLRAALRHVGLVAPDARHGALEHRGDLAGHARRRQLGGH